MTTLTTTIKFELNENLKEIATVEQDCNGTWGFTTNRGYNTWEGNENYSSFDKCYTALKQYEKSSLNNLKYA